MNNPPNQRIISHSFGEDESPIDFINSGVGSIGDLFENSPYNQQDQQIFEIILDRYNNRYFRQVGDYEGYWDEPTHPNYQGPNFAAPPHSESGSSSDTSRSRSRSHSHTRSNSEASGGKRFKTKRKYKLKYKKAKKVKKMTKKRL